MPNVWVDGCFDMGHFGHGNLLRQAQELAGPDGLVRVGVHSDNEITEHKRPPIFNEMERMKMIRGLKWGDEIVPAAPYVTTSETIEKNGCDFCVHGSDVTSTSTGQDCYGEVKGANLYREVPRTQGISTTQLIKRVLASKSDVISPYTGSPFMLSTSMIAKFVGNSNRNQSDVVMYAPGSWDLLHPGHLDFLEAARSRGDYLIAGVYNDDTVRRLKGDDFPFMNLHERAMTVLGCKFVDEVIIGAPYSITNELMEYFNVNLVVHGAHPVQPDEHGEDPFIIPGAAGKLLKIESNNDLTTEAVVERIRSRDQMLEKLNGAKEIMESLHIIEAIQSH